MDDKLHEWCLEESLKLGKPVTRIQIRTKALQLTKFPGKFKASKGWTDKFVKKFNIRKEIIKYLNRKIIF